MASHGSQAGSGHRTGTSLLNDDISNFLRKHGIPVTRENWIAANWPETPHPWTAEHEAELPEPLRYR
jgi:hypothetical protein